MALVDIFNSDIATLPGAGGSSTSYPANPPVLSAPGKGVRFTPPGSLTPTDVGGGGAIPVTMGTLTPMGEGPMDCRLHPDDPRCFQCFDCIPGIFNPPGLPWVPTLPPGQTPGPDMPMTPTGMMAVASGTQPDAATLKGLLDLFGSTFGTVPSSGGGGGYVAQSIPADNSLGTADTTGAATSSTSSGLVGKLVFGALIVGAVYLGYRWWKSRKGAA